MNNLLEQKQKKTLMNLILLLSFENFFEREMFFSKSFSK